MKYYSSYILFCMMLTGIFVFVGCGHSELESHADDIHAEDGHEGHNHGPGEHGLTTAASASDESIIDWCSEHAVPESECTRCNLSLIAGYKESGDWCAGHDLPESHCRLCNPELIFPGELEFGRQSFAPKSDEIEVSLYFRPNASVCATDGAIIQFAASNVVERAGLTIQTVRSAQIEALIDAPAEVVFDETNISIVTSTVSALVSRWQVSPGDAVFEGDVLALLKSPDIAELQSSLVAASADYDMEKKELARRQELSTRDLISKVDLERQVAVTERARARFISARGLLLSAGMSVADIDEIMANGNISNQFALRAPASGMVVNRIAQPGELLDAGKAFATIANPSSMWIEACLTEDQIKKVEIGQGLTFSSDGKGINRVGGEIIWVSRYLDPHTRIGTVRARVVDPDHRLHAGEFGRARIVRRGIEEVVLVPKDAVQWEGCCNVVFVKETADRFRPRKVQLQDSQGSYYQVTAGVQSGEEVVVDGAFLLKTELKKSSIGAGCCGLEPAG